MFFYQIFNLLSKAVISVSCKAFPSNEFVSSKSSILCMRPLGGYGEEGDLSFL